MWYHSDTMQSLLIRDLDEQLMKRLKARARSRGRSLQGEIHAILEAAAARSLAETRSLSARWLIRLSGRRQTSDSAALIRADRQRR